MTDDNQLDDLSISWLPTVWDVVNCLATNIAIIVVMWVALFKDRSYASCLCSTMACHCFDYQNMDQFMLHVIPEVFSYDLSQESEI